MQSSIRHVAAATASFTLLAGSFALAGCASVSNATITHNPPLSTFGGKSTARSAVQTAILVADTSNGLAFSGGPTPASIARRVLDVMHGRRISAASGPCVSGKKSSQTTGSTGAVTTTTDQYYDALCASIEEETVFTVSTPGSPTTSANGTVTTYDRSAAVTSYHVLTIAATNDTVTQTVTYNDSAGATVGGAALAAVGATCAGTAGSQTMTCTSAMYGTAGTGTFGQSIAQNGTAATTAGANNTVAVSVAYFGSGITGIGQTSGSWGVSGTSAFNSASASYAYTTTGSSGSGTLTLTDALYTYTVTGTLSASGLSVTIVRGTDPIATTTVDTAGNGTISYADGTTDSIWANVIDV